MPAKKKSSVDADLTTIAQTIRAGSQGSTSYSDRIDANRAGNAIKATKKTKDIQVAIDKYAVDAVKEQHASVNLKAKKTATKKSTAKGKVVEKGKAVPTATRAKSPASKPGPEAKNVIGAKPPAKKSPAPKKSSAPKKTSTKVAQQGAKVRGKVVLAKKNTAELADAGTVMKKRGRPPKPDSRRARIAAKKAELEAQGMQMRRGPVPKPKPKPVAVSKNLPRRTEPGDMRHAQSISGYRGKTHSESRRYGSSVVKVMTRKGTVAGRDYEVTINKIASSTAEPVFKRNTVAVVFADKKTGESGYIYRKADKRGNRFDQTQGAIVKDGKTVSDYVKPNRTAAGYRSSFWNRVSTDNRIIRPVDVSEGTERSVFRPSSPKKLRGGRGSSHKGGKYN